LTILTGLDYPASIKKIERTKMPADPFWQAFPLMFFSRPADQASTGWHWLNNRDILSYSIKGEHA
jgi:hypothetical protein